MKTYQVTQFKKSHGGVVLKYDAGLLHTSDQTRAEAEAEALNKDLGNPDRLSCEISEWYEAVASGRDITAEENPGKDDLLNYMLAQGYTHSGNHWTNDAGICVTLTESTSDCIYERLNGMMVTRVMVDGPGDIGIGCFIDDEPVSPAQALDYLQTLNPEP